MTEQTPGIGHNKPPESSFVNIVNRIERLTDEMKAIGEDRKDVFTEAKNRGDIDMKGLREVLRRRRMDRGELDALDAAVDKYERELQGH